MAAFHTVLIEQVRARVSPQVAAIISKWREDELVRRIFITYRNEKALRLTQFGQQMMQSCFQRFEFAVGELQPAHLIFLSARCKMPYYYGQGKLVIYDGRFAVMLRLADGNLNTIMEIDTGD